jgi:outer membrane protein OmpA-like peptidoglycan-associated protein
MNGRTFSAAATARSRFVALAIGGAVFALAAFGPTPAAVAAGESKLLAEVHFDPGSIDVTYGGRQKIERAIAAIKEQNPREIHIIGFTDTTGDEELNRRIARNRADNVASFLAEQGVTTPMVIEGKGEKGAPYQIPDNVSEPLNRCVGIIAVGPAKPPTL